MKNRSVTYRKTMKTLPLVEDPAELWRGWGRIKVAAGSESLWLGEG